MDSITAELEAWVVAYQHGFAEAAASGDFASFVAKFRLDAFLTSVPWAEPSLTAGPETAAALRGSFEAMQAQGWDHEQLHSVEVHPLNERAAMIDTEWGWFRADGEEYMRPSISYFVVRDGDEWKASAFILRDVAGGA